MNVWTEMAERALERAVEHERAAFAERFIEFRRKRLIKAEECLALAERAFANAAEAGE